MKTKIWKAKAYMGTKVDYVKSQMQINKLLLENGITDNRHTTIQNTAELVFLKELDIEGKRVKVGVKIIVPELTEKNRNQIYRCLFYYLKAKFLSLTFGFIEEYNEAFAKEFMPYLIADKQGRTIADIILPQLNKAIGYTQTGGQLYLEDKETK